MDKENIENKIGTLYIVGTPIGNLKDITLRALETLKNVDYILAEDTRTTLKLLNHFEISKPLISYHKFNERERESKIVKLLQEGNDIALVSDAGMPILSDPGEIIVNKLINLNMSVEVIPGPTALTSAIAYSNIPIDTFVFEGFIPMNSRKRKERLEKIKKETRTIIFYEAPHKLLGLLKDLYKNVGDRQVCILREITKLHEQRIYTNISEMIQNIEENGIKGEIVLIMEGLNPENDPTEDDIEDKSFMELIEEYIEEGLTKNEAIKRVAKEKGVNKNVVYMECVKNDQK